MTPLLRTIAIVVGIGVCGCGPAEKAVIISTTHGVYAKSVIDGDIEELYGVVAKVSVGDTVIQSPTPGKQLYICTIWSTPDSAWCAEEHGSIDLPPTGRVLWSDSGIWILRCPENHMFDTTGAGR